MYWCKKGKVGAQYETPQPASIGRAADECTIQYVDISVNAIMSI